MADDRDARIAQLEAELRRSQNLLAASRAEVALLSERNAALIADVDRHDRALTEVSEQHRGASEILRAIGSSATDLRAVLQTVATNAARLCDAADAQIFQVEGDLYRKVASLGVLPVTLPVGEALPLTGNTAGMGAEKRPCGY